MAWIILVVAGVLECVWAVGLKSSQGFTRLWPSVWTIATMLVSFALLSYAMKSLPLGVAYTVWVGIGAVGSVIAGAVIFGERMGLIHYACIGLIVAGIVGLKFASPGATST